MLNLMYITNNPEVAKIAEASGVQRIFIDMEYIGKTLRQGGMDTVQSHHTIDDIKNIKKHLTKSEILVRCNPIHESTLDYNSSKDEIDLIISAGADIIMLPYFKTVAEVDNFLKHVNGRTRTMLLIETPEAVDVIDEILELNGINEVFIGLNDLSLGYKMKFMFELLANGTVESLCNKFKNKNILYGFGGIAALGKGMLPAEKVILEHYRLKSSCVILSRSFCNTNIITDLDEIKDTFENGLKAIRNLENECINGKYDYDENHKEVVSIIEKIKNQ